MTMLVDRHVLVLVHALGDGVTYASPLLADLLVLDHLETTRHTDVLARVTTAASSGSTALAALFGYPQRSGLVCFGHYKNGMATPPLSS